MIFTLTPVVKAPGYTLSRLQTSRRTFWCLEDTVREVPGQPVHLWKVPGVTAIPAGTYELIVDFSNRFQKMMPHILDVEGFTGVRIHAGNSSHDTEGCLLLGNGVNLDEGRITDSRAAMIDFMDELDHLYDMNQPVQIQVLR